MALSIVDTGVQMTRGRGAAKVSLVISFKELETWAKKQQIDTAKLMSRSFGRAAAGLKKKFIEVMERSGGVNGVPKFKDFEEFTKQLRNIGPNYKLGGTLADRRRIVAFKRAGWQVIGWPDSLAEWSVKFQDAVGDQAQLNDPSWRRWAHRRAGLREVPRQYVHNPRRVIPEPFGEYVKQNLETWAKGAFYKELTRQMQKGAK